MIVDKIDTNNDGRVTEEELTDWVRHVSRRLVSESLSLCGRGINNNLFSARIMLIVQQTKIISYLCHYGCHGNIELLITWSQWSQDNI